MAAEENLSTKPHRRAGKGKPKATNALHAGILDFVTVHECGAPAASLEISSVPKRYTRYGSLLLLGPTFLSSPAPWATFFASLTERQRAELMKCILARFGPTVTHVAVNAPILLMSEGSRALVGDVDTPEENVMRRPSGLAPLYGDFGPGCLLVEGSSQPTERDFVAAYWTHTAQLKNVQQVWAPRWTMFSRGNVTEKARILQDGSNTSPFAGLTDDELGEALHRVDVVDFYVGIGYFAFCYLKRGVKRVWGWELNGWSVEGLRRGCIKNGWGVKVVRISDDGHVSHPAGADGIVQDILFHDGSTQAVRCVVMQGDNRWASKVMAEISDAFRRHGVGEGQGLNVRHCNLGLLPTSQGSWDGALRVINADTTAWLHIHENAQITEIDSMKASVLSSLSELMAAERRQSPSATCVHVERVKTYAPGIMHCVFDIQLCPS